MLYTVSVLFFPETQCDSNVGVDAIALLSTWPDEFVLEPKIALHVHVKSLYAKLT